MCKRIIASSLFFFVLLLGSCIKDDLADCPEGLRLNYCYILNTEYQCLLEKNVESLRAYIFDENTRLLVKVVTLSPDDINRKWIDVNDLPSGMYTITSWGGSSRDMEKGGFIDGDMTDPATSTFIPYVAVGRTTIDNFRMMLATEPLRATPGMDVGHTHDMDDSRIHPGEVIPLAGGGFDDIYFGIVQHVEVVDGEQCTANIDMMQDTNTLHVKVKGWELLSSRAVDNQEPFICVSGHNERYGYDNSIDRYAREVCYEPYFESDNGTEISVDIRVMHLDINRFKDEPVLFYIRNAVTGRNIISPIDVINDVILKAKDKQGNLLWPDQEAIDRVNEFSFEVSVLADLSVSITVNGFEIINTNVDISRP
ncbi:FimB/Mfa2 family fimbrial subunit [Bacteroides sp. UBA939]|uniref:FimB/Mfa2 family fimbrial subunit n=1 Tax=Bacteroides sp. UBA939 TaxID=1946092 RepID=UPI0025C4FC51|nr:FimB/Mfa2 family fimbrial subunit [Bacteroides sp. UBA939]